MRPFRPDKLPFNKLNWQGLIPLIAAANRSLARYDGSLQNLVNPDMMLSPLRTREAVLSSRIEGTQASLEDVLAFEAEPDVELTAKNVDILEILNYRHAMQIARQELEKRPLSLRLIRNLHFILLDSVRGHDKARGAFRTSQNYIGAPGTPQEQASYIPPDPMDVPDLLDNLEKYIHKEDEPDVLVQLSLVHAQFELIHPFLDGNGRVGRLLIPLFLYSKQIISSPSFYMSAYLEKYRDEYYARLQALSAEDDFQGWVAFFLKAMIVQANTDTEKVRQINDLYDEVKQEIGQVTGSPSAVLILDTLFSRLHFSTSQFAKQTGIAQPSYYRILKRLTDAGILRQVRPGRGSRPALYMFPRLLEIVSV